VFVVCGYEIEALTMLGDGPLAPAALGAVGAAPEAVAGWYSLSLSMARSENGRVDDSLTRENVRFWPEASANPLQVPPEKFLALSSACGLIPLSIRLRRCSLGKIIRSSYSEGSLNGPMHRSEFT
jgi:hypothetical protein